MIRILAGFAAAAAAGCAGNLEDIDRRVDRLLAQRSDSINGGAIAPERATPDPDLPSRRSLSDWVPPTINPPASELRYERAPRTRDYAEKLRELQQPTATAVVELDLEGVWRQSQKSAREYLAAEEDYILAGIRLLIERHQWSPRLFATTSAEFTSAQVDGDSTTALNLINQLGVRQRLPFGGEAAARWVWSATENLRSAATDQYRQSSALIADASIPLLRGAGLVAEESRIQAERDLVYAARNFESFRRSFLVSIARDYFAVLQQQADVESTELQVKSLQNIRDRQQALYDAGRVAEFQVNLAQNDLLSAESSLANARESLKLAQDRLRVRLGLPDSTRILLVAFTLDIREPEVTLDHATDMALAYRLDLQNRRDQLADTKRGVLNAMNRLLPDLNLSGGITLPTDADEREGGFVYELDDVQYNAALTLSWPLDREEERLNLRASIINLEQSRRNLDEFTDNLVIEVRQRVRDIERARFNLQLAEQRVQINIRREEEQELKADQVDTQARVDTANALRDARQARDQALTDLRNSILDYLLSTATLRVQRDGTFQPLPGMQDPEPGDAIPPAGGEPLAPPMDQERPVVDDASAAP